MDQQRTPGWGSTPKELSWDGTSASQHVETHVPTSSEALLWQMVNEMCQESAQVCNFQQQQQITTTAAMKAIKAALQALGNAIGALQQISQPLHAPPPSLVSVASMHTPPVDHPLKAQKLCLFNADANEVEPFINKIEIQDQNSPPAHGPQPQQNGLSSTYLKDGNPKIWYFFNQTHATHLLSDFPVFLASFVCSSLILIIRKLPFTESRS